MRNLYIMMTIATLSVLASCSKTLKVDPVSFNVSTSSNTYQAGDTVNFVFEGQPDMITFYSGETGHNYEYRDRTVAKGKPQMQFTSYAQYGKQENTLHLFISTDFDGKYDSTDIYNASWTDITDKANLSSGSPNTPSGIIELSENIPQGKSFYFAFKFTGTYGSTQKTWTIEDFQLNLLMDDGSISSVADMVTAGWTAVNIENDNKAWKISASQLKMVGGPASAADNEDWLITAPLNPNKVSPDRGTAIKEISKNLFRYTHIYSKTGLYKAVFVGTNATANEESSVVRTIDLTIK